MWHKNDGDGVLEGAGARLLKVAVAAYVENLRGQECWDDDVDRDWADEVRDNWFDVEHVARMEHGQRLHMIATVAKALLDPAVAAPILTADNEAMVYQIYHFLCHEVDVDADTLDMVRDDPDEASHVRLLMFGRNAIADAARKAGLCLSEDAECCGEVGTDDECEHDPGPDARPERWHGIVEKLADTVLWDRDWEMERNLADADPDRANAVKRLAAIDEGYFTTPAEEPTPGQVSQAKAYLESLADEIAAENTLAGV